MFDPWVAGWLYADAVAITRAQPAAWPQRQRRRLRDLIGAVGARSTWWRGRTAAALSAGPGVDAMLRTIPVSRKRELMQHFDRWVTDPALRLARLSDFAHRHFDDAADFDRRFTVWESSGSSGEPALFVQDAQSLAVADALELARGPHTLLGRGGGPLLDGSPWTQRYAFVGAIDGPFASIVSLRRLQRVNPWARWSVRAFSFLQPGQALVQQLHDWNPTVLMTYPTMARVLADWQRQGRLRLRLNAVWTGGETVTPALRAAIVSAFRCPLHDSYGASECLNIASECSAGALHLHADWAILEAVDEHARPVPAGRFGDTTLLTNLANVAQPIIRYDLGDRVRFVPGTCRCGSSLPVIEVEGREDEVLAPCDASRRPVLLSPLSLTTVIEEASGLFDFRLRQVGDSDLQLELFGDEATAPGVQQVADALRNYLRQQGLGNVALHLHRRPRAAHRGRSGKLQRIVRDETASVAHGAARSQPRAHAVATPPVGTVARMRREPGQRGVPPQS